MADDQLLYELPETTAFTVQRDVTYSTIDLVDLKMDVYMPGNLAANQLHPCVIFIHGDGPELSLRDAKEWGQYIGWGSLLATQGCIGITFNHRSSNMFTAMNAVEADIQACLEYVLRHAQEYAIDVNRLGIWLCSAGGPVAMSILLRERRPYVRCVAAYYPLLDVQQLRTQISSAIADETLQAFSPIFHMQNATHQQPPLLIVRAGQDREELNATIDRFIQASLASNASIELINYPEGQHGFDTRTDLPQTRSIIHLTLTFFQEHLFTP